jgi:formylmethanofuran dehydrogenase subunit E
VKKVRATYPVIEWLGTCTKCGETNLARQFGDEIVEGEPVCVACTRNLPATERSEGARPSEARQR